MLKTPRPASAVDHSFKVLLSAVQPRVAGARVGSAEVGLQRIVVSCPSQALDSGRISMCGKSTESGAPVHFDLVEEPCGRVRSGQADAAFVGRQAYLGVQK